MYKIYMFIYICIHIHTYIFRKKYFNSNRKNLIEVIKELSGFSLSPRQKGLCL